MAKDWKKLPDGKEKYNAYLCSREWSVLKEAVHKRAGGMCERCRVFPIDAVHHTTYARKYKEELEDLQGNCKHCHDFTHAKANRDPQKDAEWIKYVRQAREEGKEPVGFHTREDLVFNATVAVINHCLAQAEAMYTLSLQCENLDDPSDDRNQPLNDASEEFNAIATAIQKYVMPEAYILWLDLGKPCPKTDLWDDVT